MTEVRERIARIREHFADMYCPEGEDDESVGVEEQGGVIRDIPLTFGDIRWVLALLQGDGEPVAEVVDVDWEDDGGDPLVLVRPEGDEYMEAGQKLYTRPPASSAPDDETVEEVREAFEECLVKYWHASETDEWLAECVVDLFRARLTMGKEENDG